MRFKGKQKQTKKTATELVVQDYLDHNRDFGAKNYEQCGLNKESLWRLCESNQQGREVVIGYADRSRETGQKVMTTLKATNSVTLDQGNKDG